MKTATVALAVACAAAALYYTNGGIGAADNADPTNEADTQGNALDYVMGAVGGIGSSPADAPTAQRQAWLDMIAISEGTYGKGDNGYNVLVNPGGLFDNGYVDHPRELIHVGGTLYSTAAGRYQIIAKTWDGVKAAIGAPDFSPAWQDAAALELTRQRGALAMVDAGDIAGAITACNREWASFAGSPYNQNPHDMGTMIAWFEQQGGATA